MFVLRSDAEGESHCWDELASVAGVAILAIAAVLLGSEIECGTERLF